MDKEKILSKSRQQKDDDGVQFVSAHGYKVGFAFFTFVISIMILSAMFFSKSDQTITILALSSLYLTFWTGELYAKYKFSKKKSRLVFTVIGAIAAILTALAYILRILEVI